MFAILEIYDIPVDGVLVNPMQSSPSSQGFHLAVERASHSESQSPELTSTWAKRENTEHSNTDEDLELHQLMEDIKRYIRSIDISNL